MKRPAYLNMERTTLSNKDYRTVNYTSTHLQLVFMTLKPGEDIPFEVHKGDQFIRVETGKAVCVIGKTAYLLEAGGNDTVIIPAGSHHYVMNISKTKDLSLYALYAPQAHKSTDHDTRQPPVRERQRMDYQCYKCPTCGEESLFKGLCEFCGWFTEE